MIFLKWNKMSRKNFEYIILKIFFFEKKKIFLELEIVEGILVKLVYFEKDIEFLKYFNFVVGIVFNLCGLYSIMYV